MWSWLNCYLSGRHDYGVTCASGSIYLCCVHCGRRSNGWAVAQTLTPAKAKARIAACLLNASQRNS